MIAFTISCHSTVFHPRCGPRSAETDSPWGQRERAQETKVTLKENKHQRISRSQFICLVNHDSALPLQRISQLIYTDSIMMRIENQL